MPKRKRIRCPHCNKGLNYVDFYEAEYVRWFFNQEEMTMEGPDHLDGSQVTIKVECPECEEEITGFFNTLEVEFQ